ncbi:hypothetical protein pVco14_065 [Vibrio phage pVco-14]|nr:hypothetical protein pVco14_065 [Vibrio phage pVco-14]
MYVCDQTGNNFTTVQEALDHALLNPLDDEIVLTSASYGFFCGVNLLLLPNSKYTEPDKVELTPGSSNASQFGTGLVLGHLLGDMIND